MFQAAPNQGDRRAIIPLTKVGLGVVYEPQAAAKAQSKAASGEEANDDCTWDDCF